LRISCNIDLGQKLKLLTFLTAEIINYSWECVF